MASAGFEFPVHRDTLPGLSKSGTATNGRFPTGFPISQSLKISAAPEQGKGGGLRSEA